MSYHSPVADIVFSLRHVADVDAAVASGLYGDLDLATLEAVIGEAGKFAQDKIAPLNRIGDKDGSTFANGVVTTPPGFRDVFRQWAAAGWAGVTAPVDMGGMGLPFSVNAACLELWAGASMGFALCPLLGEGALHALDAHGSTQLRETYLPKLISGEWTGTMNLTEPQAGSDLGTIATTAKRAGDGSFLLRGQKIFITYGEHDMTDNIVHLVLARIEGAPAGLRGLSLFLAPKFLPNAQGGAGMRNDLRCASIEHKLGIHASPTCVMIYGDNGGATGWLVGEENKGLAAMFVMMNSARLGVGLQGVAIGERALQQALDYARERKQGRSAAHARAGMSPILEHPDVQRMLMTMKSLVQAARGICHLNALAIDGAHFTSDPAARALAADRAALLTPLAKAFSTDVGDEVASLGVQVHGGMGYIEETGAAQFMRDSRIAAIYEGTNGIQALDLVQRKLPLRDGAVMRGEIATMRTIVDKVALIEGFGGAGAALGAAIDALERATSYLLELPASDVKAAQGGAVPFLRLFGLALGGACLAKAALAARSLSAGDVNDARARVALARFFCERIVIFAPALDVAVRSGAVALDDYQFALAEPA